MKTKLQLLEKATQKDCRTWKEQDITERINEEKYEKALDDLINCFKIIRQCAQAGGYKYDPVMELGTALSHFSVRAMIAGK